MIYTSTTLPPALLLLCLLVACSKPPARPPAVLACASTTYLATLTKEYHTHVLEALLLTDSNYAGKAASMAGFSEDNICSLVAGIDDNPGKRDTLFTMAEQHLDQLPEPRRTTTLTTLECWLKNDALLAIAIDGHLYQNVSFPEVAVSVPELKPLLRKYVRVPEKEWGAMEFGDECHLYYDVQAYLLTLPERKRITFFRHYFAQACKLATVYNRQAMAMAMR